MTKSDPARSMLVPWKIYLTLISECLLSFTLATFCLAIFFTHGGRDSLSLSVLLIVLYLFVIYVCIKRMVQGFPLAALMLFIPIAPLIPIAVILMLIPVLQALK